MNRKIKIENLNDGKEFEVPERKVKHTRYTLQKTADSSDAMRGYDTSFYSAYIVLKSKFPNITEKIIEELSDDKLSEISRIIWGTANFICPHCKKEIDLTDAKNFQRPKAEDK